MCIHSIEQEIVVVFVTILQGVELFRGTRMKVNMKTGTIFIQHCSMKCFLFFFQVVLVGLKYNNCINDSLFEINSFSTSNLSFKQGATAPLVWAEGVTSGILSGGGGGGNLDFKTK